MTEMWLAASDDTGRHSKLNQLQIWHKTRTPDSNALGLQNIVKTYLTRKQKEIFGFICDVSNKVIYSRLWNLLFFNILTCFCQRWQKVSADLKLG